MHNAVALCICACVCLATLTLKCNSGGNNSYRLSCTTVKYSQYNIMLKKCRVNKKQHYCMREQSFHIKSGQEVVHQNSVG